MERKNTMLLTVIAVATLLVAVVGATFAYYSVVNGSISSTQKVTSTTAKVGYVTLTSAGTPMYLNITGDQMAEKVAGTKYYHTTTANTPAVLEANKQTTSVATFKVDGSDSTTTYTCTFTASVVTIDKAMDGDTHSAAWTNLTNGDAKVTLSVSKTSGSNATFGNAVQTNYDLATAKTAQTTNNVSFVVTGDTEYDVKALVEFDSTREQNNIAELNVETQVNLSDLSCTTGSSALS